MSAVVRRLVKDSDNFAAELVLKELGKVVRADGSSAGGVAAVRSVLGRLGVPVGTSTDGSGLSSQDRQTPAGQVQLLHAADGSGSGPDFRAALPVGCVDGTLAKRFCGTAAAGRVAAKTGTLAGVRALAGYTTTASGRDVWFAFQLTGVQDGTRALRADGPGRRAAREPRPVGARTVLLVSDDGLADAAAGRRAGRPHRRPRRPRGGAGRPGRRARVRAGHGASSTAEHVDPGRGCGPSRPPRWRC